MNGTISENAILNKDIYSATTNYYGADSDSVITSRRFSQLYALSTKKGTKQGLILIKINTKNTQFHF